MLRLFKIKVETALFYNTQLQGFDLHLNLTKMYRTKRQGKKRKYKSHECCTNKKEQTNMIENRDQEALSRTCKTLRYREEWWSIVNVFF